MAPQPQEHPVDLADVRLLGRLRSGEPEALNALWMRWRDPIWSTCAAMTGDRGVAVDLLRAVYSELGRECRGWSAPLPVACFVAAHTWRVVGARLELPGLTGITPTVPFAMAPPDPGAVATLVAGIEPNVRLVYLLDLFFACPAAGLARLVGVSEQVLRGARSQASWALVARRSA